MNKFDLIFNEVDDSTIAKVTAAVASGLAATAVGHHIYKKHQEKKVMEKYGGKNPEEENTKDASKYYDAILNAVDANSARYMVHKK